jgi:RND family efflux transporter MFP subunit
LSLASIDARDDDRLWRFNSSISTQRNQIEMSDAGNLSKEIAMDAITELQDRPSTDHSEKQRGGRSWIVPVVALVIAAAVIALGVHFFNEPTKSAAASSPPIVTVSEPLQRDLDSRLQFLGQFSPVERVELRAQVGGTLTKIGFKDGDIVQKGALLFEIDPTQYQVKLSEATAQLEGAQARYDLATQELTRAQTLKQSDAGTIENVDQRAGEQRAAQAAINEAQALIRDARFDLDHCRIASPFTGRMGTHLVSVGNLVSGSRAGAGATTLLATVVSLNPIYLDFDMSESDYLTFLRERTKQKGALADRVDAALSDETEFRHPGTLNFIDNSLDRSSGTIHARATIPNGDLLLTPGVFGRVLLPISTPAAVFLVPDESVLPDQSEHVVLTVGPDDVVTPKKVQVGDLRGGLRVIRAGLTQHDKVIIGGVAIAAPGSKVTPHPGTITFGAAQDRSSVQP